MNKFVILACLALLSTHYAAARPDLSLGYRYHQGHSSGGGSVLTAPASIGIGAGGSSISSYSPTASGSSYYNTIPSVGQFSTSGFAPSTQTVVLNGGGGSSISSGHSAGIGIGSGAGVGIGAGLGAGVGIGIGGGSSSTQFVSSSSQQQVNYDEQQAFISHLQNHQPPIVTKHFYVHSAPVDHDEQQIVRYVNVGRPQKNYRVVFIDAPSSTTSKAKIIANVAPVEDKTAIYVLSKKSNALDVSAEVVTQAPVNNKPDVFFVKYKTPEEAIHAQHTIQAQYDALGGTSDISNEGVIPVSSVIGSLDGASAGVGAAESDAGFVHSSGLIGGGSSISGGGLIGGGSIGGGSIGGGSSTVTVVSSGGSSSSSGGSGIGIGIGGGSSSSSIGYDAEGSSNIGAAAIPIVHTGDNTQATYLPAHK